MCGVMCRSFSLFVAGNMRRGNSLLSVGQVLLLHTGGELSTIPQTLRLEFTVLASNYFVGAAKPC